MTVDVPWELFWRDKDVYRDEDNEGDVKLQIYRITKDMFLLLLN